MKFYFKRLCPYCNTRSSFTNYGNLRRHILTLHQRILPARKNTEKEDKNAQHLKDDNKDNNIKYKLSCPSCVHYEDTKQELATHLESHLHFAINDDEQVDAQQNWSHNGMNITSDFIRFRKHCIQNLAEYRNVDANFNQLLACSYILVVQKKHLYGSIPANYFSPSTLKSMHATLREDHNLKCVFQNDLENSIKPILKAFRDHEKDLVSTSMSLLRLAETASMQEANVILAITYLLPAMKDLDDRPIHEAELTTSYIHPLMQGLFALTKDNIVARCANITIGENDERKQPDYVVDLYAGYQHQAISCVGEIKPSDASFTSLVEDFYRLNLFTGEIINTGFPCALSFQVYGPFITFYYMFRRGGFNVNVEVAKIEIPLHKPDLLKLTMCLDELFTIATLHHVISEKEKTEIMPLPLLPLDYVETKKATLPRKRKPSLGSI